MRPELVGCGLAGLLLWGGFSPAPRAGAAQIRSGPIVTTLILFAGTPGGLYRSRDWGGSWQPVERRGLTGDDPQQIGEIHAVLPLGPLVYVAGEHGLLVSEDFGEAWRRLSVPGPVLSVTASRYPAADPTLFVGTPRGLLRSRDGGERFEQLALPETQVTRIEWPGPALLLASGAGVLRSDDGGESFEGLGAGLPPGAVLALALSAFFRVDPTLFASLASGGVFYSADGGRSWQLSGLEQARVSDLIWFGPYVYAVSERGLLRSEDAGRSWSPLGEGLVGRRLGRLVFPAAPQSGAEALITTDDGLFRSFDGGERWQRAGFAGQPVNCVATFPAPDPKPGKRR